MGGCGRAELTVRSFGDLSLPSIQIHSDMPIIATLGSQYAGWQINEKGYFAIGSGPARALAQKPKKIYTEIGYKDDFDRGIMVLETQKKPPESLVRRFADECHISAGNLVILLTPTTSVAGATQISGRVVETGIHKLRRLGLDSNKITHAFGYAPIPSVHPKFTVAMARTNDAILYGGVTYYVVEDETDENLRELVKKAPSIASKFYGKPFIEIFKEAEYDFYKIDPNLFAPASVTITNATSGRTFKNGMMNLEALKQSYGLC
jgi:methenyltetrahydromethanopterin cyclohydrolase